MTVTCVKFFVTRLFYSGRWRTAIFVMLILAVTETLAELFFSVLATIVLSPHEMLSLSYSTPRIIARVISLPIFTLAMYLPYFIWAKTVSKRSDASFRAFIVFLLSQFLTLSISGILIYDSGNVSTTMQILIALIVLVSGVADVFVFRAIQKITQAHALEKSFHVNNQSALLDCRKWATFFPDQSSTKCPSIVAGFHKRKSTNVRA